MLPALLIAALVVVAFRRSPVKSATAGARVTRQQRAQIDRARTSRSIGEVLQAYALAKRLGLDDTAQVIGYQLDHLIDRMQQEYPPPRRPADDED